MPTTPKLTLLKKIHSAFPRLHWKTAKYVSVGFDNDVIVLDDALVFRFPKNSYSKKIFKNESGLLTLLSRRLATPVPRYTYMAPGFTFAGYPLIHGTDLTASGFAKMSAGQKRKLAAQLGAFLTELHAVPVKSVAKFNPRKRAAAGELPLLAKQFKKYVYPSLTTAQKARFDVFFAQLITTLSGARKSVLVHGDFSGDHFILNSRAGLAGIIDFTDFALHEPAFDLVHLWGLGADFVRAVFAHYHGKNKHGMLERSHAFAQASAVWNMMMAKKNGKMNFKKWYARFKKIEKL